MRKQLGVVVLLLLTCWLLSGCSLLKLMSARMQPRSQFVPVAANPQVAYAPGSEAMALRMSKALDGSKAIIEAAHGVAFLQAPRVFVCDAECFSTYTPLNKSVPAGHFLDSVFMNDDVLRQRERSFNMSPENFLAHELAHLLLYQHVGGIAYMQVPAWFREGLAVSVSNGAGSEGARAAEAAASIAAGKAFDPAESGSLFNDRTASSYGLRSSIFYRQAGMFVDYLRELDGKAFQAALRGVLKGEDLQNSFRTAYGQPLAVLWPGFEARVKQLAERREASK